MGRRGEITHFWLTRCACVDCVYGCLCSLSIKRFLCTRERVKIRGAYALCIRARASDVFRLSGLATMRGARLASWLGTLERSAAGGEGERSLSRGATFACPRGEFCEHARNHGLCATEIVCSASRINVPDVHATRSDAILKTTVHYHRTFRPGRAHIAWTRARARLEHAWRVARCALVLFSPA